MSESLHEILEGQRRIDAALKFCEGLPTELLERCSVITNPFYSIEQMKSVVGPGARREGDNVYGYVGIKIDKGTDGKVA